MKKQLSLFALVILGAATMYGQASRTWVSGVGDDANPCSRTAPCKTFAGAISKTAAGGEIDALDPGGFGALTITKAITLDGGGGQVASVLVAGTNGIVVQAGANDVVIIRNLRINGITGSGNGGLNGIRFLAGKDLNVENDYIFGFNNNCVDISMAASATVHIVGSVFKNCQNGVSAQTSSGTVKVGINETSIMLMTTNGIQALQGTRVDADHTFISAASGSGISASGLSNTQQAIVSFDYGDLVNGNHGATTGANGFIVISHSTITGNGGTAYNSGGGGVVNAYATGTASANNGTNRVHDNNALGAAIYITEN
jgi:hypothetical protein